MLKRVFDIAVSGTALFFLWPAIAVTALLVRINLGTPVLFRQQRPGLNEKIFSVMKFRTMNNARNADGQLLPDSERLTPFGRTLRATSLDELPQLFNVIRGDMSIVGPRPLLPEYLPLYNSRQKIRHQVRPGITGWAQINGRNALSWEDRFEMDAWYVENQSFMLDLKIIAKTFIKVFARSGVNQPGSATMEKFTGSQPETRDPDRKI